MNCLTCKTEMSKCNEYKNSYVKMEWFKCPECDSRSEITYGLKDDSIVAMSWSKFEVKYSMIP